MPLLNDNKTEEERSLSLRWIRVRNMVKEQFGQRPDINAMLYLIGMNEVGVVKETWEKEEKQDLMHVAMCRLFAADGYYKLTHTDEEGWPHYEPVQGMAYLTLREQEETLKLKIIEYFEGL